MCYALNVCVCLDSYSEIQCDDMRRWRLWGIIRFRRRHEGSTLVMGLVPFSDEEETPGFPLSAVSGHNKKRVVYKQEREPSLLTS